MQFVVGDLRDGAIGEAPVGLERIDDGGHEFGGDVHSESSNVAEFARVQIVAGLNSGEFSYAIAQRRFILR